MFAGGHDCSDRRTTGRDRIGHRDRRGRGRRGHDPRGHDPRGRANCRRGRVPTGESGKRRGLVRQWSGDRSSVGRSWFGPRHRDLDDDDVGGDLRRRDPGWRSRLGHPRRWIVPRIVRRDPRPPGGGDPRCRTVRIAKKILAPHGAARQRASAREPGHSLAVCWRWSGDAASLPRRRGAQRPVRGSVRGSGCGSGCGWNFACPRRVRPQSHCPRLARTRRTATCR